MKGNRVILLTMLSAGDGNGCCPFPSLLHPYPFTIPLRKLDQRALQIGISQEVMSTNHLVHGGFGMIRKF